MSPDEFSNQFDVLYNNITSQQAPGLNEYEKSVFLTKGQYEIVKNYFMPEGNKYNKGYDGSTKRQIDFSMLTVDSSKDLSSATPATWVINANWKNVKTCEWDDGVMMVLNESVKVLRGTDEKVLVVVPLDYAELNRLMNKPYKRPLKTQAWRLISNNNAVGGKQQIQLVPGPADTIQTYSIRYVKRPRPIIVGDLDDDVTLEGYSFGEYNAVTAPYKTQGCMLDPSLHEEILQRAVELAKAAWVGDLNSEVEMGKRSE